MTITCDFLIVGAGIAGATAAYHLTPHGKVVVLEREASPGYHTTGRSAAQFFDTYGGRDIQRFNQASRPFFDQPPERFTDMPLLTPRGAAFIARDDQLHSLERHRTESAAAGANIFYADPAEILQRVPVLRPDYIAAALDEPDSMHIDVDAVHQGYLRGARRAGMALHLDAEVTALRSESGGWRVESKVGSFSAGVLINAAGAWCDALAGLAGVEAVGLVPKRRTVIVVDPPAGIDLSAWPLVIDIDEQFYFKPDAGRLLASPANEDPMQACDVQPEELDIAILVDRLQRATTIPIRRIENRWAGLRSFVADKNLVIGMDSSAPGFFWLAGQGGYGIQTSPAAGQAVAGLLVDGRLPEHLSALGLTSESVAPERLRG